MAPYIYMERNGIHIIDLNKTVVKIDEAAEALKNLARSGRKVLFVGTKKTGSGGSCSSCTRGTNAVYHRALGWWYAHQLPHDPQGCEENGPDR